MFRQTGQYRKQKGYVNPLRWLQKPLVAEAMSWRFADLGYGMLSPDDLNVLLVASKIELDVLAVSELVPEVHVRRDAVGRGVVTSVRAY